jgi:putative ABC transport system permease protein
VLFNGDASQMASIKAVGQAIRCAASCSRRPPPTRCGPMPRRPRPGTAYADPRLLQALGLKVGDRLEFGAGAVRIARVLQSEPDASGELFQLSPPLLVNLADIEAAGLLGPAAAPATGSTSPARLRPSPVPRLARRRPRPGA